MKTEYLPFLSEMIPEAGELLAKRHTCNRQVLPLLPASLEDPHAASLAVENIWKSRFRNGYASFRNGRMVAYLIGDFENQPWARCGYVYLPGYALAGGESIAILQDLYALLGEDWVKRGIFSHNLYISAADTDVIQGLFSIGFGQERVNALLDLRTLDIPSLDEPQGVIIRRAGRGDEDRLGSVAYVMVDALSSAPYWLPIPHEESISMKERWAGRVNDEWMIWMALEENKTIGTVAFLVEQDYEVQMLASANILTLGTAATRSEERGRGIANILTWRGLEQARRNGFETCAVQWVSPNLLASRYWPRFGFRAVDYRLSKQIHPEIAWTRLQ
jgi:predicted N-acetyltransferase YhbS